MQAYKTFHRVLVVAHATVHSADREVLVVARTEFSDLDMLPASKSKMPIFIWSCVSVLQEISHPFLVSAIAKSKQSRTHS